MSLKLLLFDIHIWKFLSYGCNFFLCILNSCILVFSIWILTSWSL